MDSKELRNLQEAYMEVVENQQLDEISQKTATRAYAERRTGEFEGDDSPERIEKTDKLEKRIKKKFGEKGLAHAEKAAEVKTFGRKDASGRLKQSPQPRIQTSDHENRREFKRELRIMRDRRLRAAREADTNEQVDLYDIILSHLLDEGYAETPEAAEAIMVNMSEEWRDDIVDETINEGRRTSLSALSRESQQRRADKERGRPETQDEKHRRLAMGRYSPSQYKWKKVDGQWKNMGRKDGEKD